MFGYYIVGNSAPNLPLHLSSGEGVDQKAVSSNFQGNTIWKNDSPSLTRILLLTLKVLRLLLSVPDDVYARIVGWKMDRPSGVSNDLCNDLF